MSCFLPFHLFMLFVFVNYLSCLLSLAPSCLRELMAPRFSYTMQQSTSRREGRLSAASATAWLNKASHTVTACLPFPARLA